MQQQLGKVDQIIAGIQRNVEDLRAAVGEAVAEAKTGLPPSEVAAVRKFLDGWERGANGAQHSRRVSMPARATKRKRTSKRRKARATGAPLPRTKAAIAARRKRYDDIAASARVLLSRGPRPMAQLQHPLSGPFPGLTAQGLAAILRGPAGKKAKITLQGGTYFAK